MGKKKYSLDQIDITTPDQKDRINELLSALSGKSSSILSNLGSNQIQDQPIFGEALGTLSNQLSAPYDTEAVSSYYQKNVADPSRESFLKETLPVIQERFGRSSASSNLALKGATDLEKNLASGLSQELLNQQRLSTQTTQNAINQALGFAQSPQLSQSRDIQSLLSALGLGIGKDLFALKQTRGTEGYGGAVGSALGSALGSYLGKDGASILGKIGSAIGSQF